MYFPYLVSTPYPFSISNEYTISPAHIHSGHHLSSLLPVRTPSVHLMSNLYIISTVHVQIVSESTVHAQSVIYFYNWCPDSTQSLWPVSSLYLTSTAHSQTVPNMYLIATAHFQSGHQCLQTMSCLYTSLQPMFKRYSISIAQLRTNPGTNPHLYSTSITNVVPKW